MDQSQIREQVLRSLAKRAGYKVGHVTPLENGRVAAELFHDGDFDTANLVAAWFGLISQEPKTLAFHEHEDGPDVLHTWLTGARRENVLEAARKLQIPHFHVSPKGRVYAWDQGRRASAGIITVARNSRAQDHEAYKGTGQLLGSNGGPGSTSRASYRDTIQKYSNE